MYVILLSYTKDLSVMDAARPAHLEWLQKYYDEKLFLASGRQNPAKGGVILSRAMPRDRLEEILKEDPFAIQNLATYEIIEFEPKMTSPELSGVA